MLRLWYFYTVSAGCAHCCTMHYMMLHAVYLLRYGAMVSVSTGFCKWGVVLPPSGDGW